MELSAYAGAQQIKSRSCRTKKEPPHFLSGIPYGLANGGGSRFRSILWQGRAVRPTHAPQIKRKLPQTSWGSFFMPVVGVEPTRVISTRDFEFWGGFSIWCHLVIFKVIWCPTLKQKNNSTSNEFLINLRFFVTFPLGSDFSIWKVKKEIGGMFRRNAEPVIQDCAHRLFSFFGKYFKPVQFRGRLICIQNEATKPGAHPGSDTQ